MKHVKKFELNEYNEDYLIHIKELLTGKITEKLQELFVDEDFVKYAKEYLDSDHMMNLSDSVPDFEYNLYLRPDERIMYEKFKTKDEKLKNI